MLSPSRNATVDAQKASHQSFFLNRESVSTSLLLNVPRIGNHRNSDEQKEREILLTPPASEEQKSSEKSALKKNRLPIFDALQSTRLPLAKAGRTQLARLKQNQLFLQTSSWKTKIKSGAATLKQRNLLLVQKAKRTSNRSLKKTLMITCARGLRKTKATGKSSKLFLNSPLTLSSFFSFLSIYTALRRRSYGDTTIKLSF